MYVIVIPRMDEVEEIIGPFDHEEQAKIFCEVHQLEDYSNVMMLSEPDGWEK